MNSPRAGSTRFAVRGNARLAYERVPQAEGIAQATVVLLHALLAGRSALHALRDQLAPDYRVILPDARGHGASAALANQRFTVADMAADLLAILDAEAIDTAHLVGHGLGGAAVVELARRLPKRARSLILIEPTLPTVLDNDRDLNVVAARDDARRITRATADLAYKGQTDQALDTILDQRWGEDWRERLTRPRLAAVRRQAGALAGSLAALDSYTLDRADVVRLELPALLVSGTEAPLLTRLVCERLALWLPRARLETIPGATDRGLPLADETSAALSAQLRAFLSLHDAS